MVARVTFISFRVFLEGCHGWYSSKPILVRSRQVSLISEARPCWSAGFEILCMSEPLFLITYSRVCKQDTLSHHFIQPSCKYFGSHQLCLDRKHLARVTTATVSTSEAKMSKFIVSWDFWVIAITRPRASLSFFSPHVPSVGLGFAYVHIHAALPGICNVSPFQE